MFLDDYLELTIGTLKKLRLELREMIAYFTELDESIKERIDQLINIDSSPKKKEKLIRDLLEKHGYPENEIIRLLKVDYLFYFSEEKLK